MLEDEYRSEPLFPYATGMFWIFPTGFRKDWDKGSIHETKYYTIYFKEGTPEDIKQRVIKDYAEYRRTHEIGDD